jgi:lipopolysaccharide transport system permease protein
MSLLTQEGARSVDSTASADAIGKGAAAPAPRAPAAAPAVVIEPGRMSWSWLDLRELWAHRELLYFLTWRDIKVRYKQTALGLAWVLIQPLLATLIFTVFLGQLARVPSDGVPYPLLVFLGLLGWNFFSSSVTSSGNSLVSNAHLITKVYFPRVMIPAAAVAARLVDFGISILILGGFMVYYRVGPTRNMLMLPVLVLATTLIALGCGMLFSALNVKYRDVGIVLPVLLQLWMFASPVVYSSSIVPAAWRGVYSLNPFVGLIDGLRASVLGRAFDWWSLSVALGTAVLLPVFAAYLFRRVEAGFADEV